MVDNNEVGTSLVNNFKLTVKCSAPVHAIGHLEIPRETGMSFALMELYGKWGGGGGVFVSLDFFCFILDPIQILLICVDNTACSKGLVIHILLKILLRITVTVNALAW